MIDRYLLRYFLAVIDQGNFSKAAQHCHVSQPTLSAGIGKLETHLGRKLFHRTNRRVELTEAGAALALHARRIEVEFLAAERDVQGTRTGALVRLGTLASVPGAWIADFTARLPAEERVELVEGRERDLLERLNRGRIDVALTILRDDNGKFARIPILTEGYGLAMAADHPLAGHQLIEASALMDEPMIVRRHCELLSETSRHFTARGVRPFFPARTTSDDHALRLVKAGLGITVMPDCFRIPGIVRPRLADFSHSRQIGLLFAPHVDADALAQRPSLRLLMDGVEANAHGGD